MARISGIDLPRDKRVLFALPYILGIGPSLSKKILEACGVDPATKVKDLSEAEVAKLREMIDRNYRVEGDLKRAHSADIARLTEINCYRGVRHRRGLPVRGQRTSTNARTRKGPKRTVGIKRKAPVGKP
jgi:small subunit ribosomal protein S13